MLKDFLEEVGDLQNGGALWNDSWKNDLDSGNDSEEFPEGAEVVAKYSKNFGHIPILCLVGELVKN